MDLTFISYYLLPDFFSPLPVFTFTPLTRHYLKSHRFFHPQEQSEYLNTYSLKIFVRSRSLHTLSILSFSFSFNKYKIFDEFQSNYTLYFFIQCTNFFLSFGFHVHPHRFSFTFSLICSSFIFFTPQEKTSPGLMAKLLDDELEVSEFKFQSRYFTHLQTNNHKKEVPVV